MRLEPRYGNQAIITMDATFPRPGEALVAQRIRQEEMFGRFGAKHWAAPTRRPGWSVRDTVAYLAVTTELWARSVRAGLAGEPSERFEGHDLAAHPDRLVAGLSELDGPAVLERFQDANDALIGTVRDLDAEGWSTTAESPLGHVAVDRVVDHGLWDAWVREHDIRVKHGIAYEGDPEELAAVLRYATVVGPATGEIGIDGFAGTLVVETTDLDAIFTVEVSTSIAVFDRGAAPGTPTLRGPVVALIEAMSLRRPLPADAPEEAHEIRRSHEAAFG